MTKPLMLITHELDTQEILIQVYFRIDESTRKSNSWDDFSGGVITSMRYNSITSILTAGMFTISISGNINAMGGSPISTEWNSHIPARIPVKILHQIKQDVKLISTSSYTPTTFKFGTRTSWISNVTSSKYTPMDKVKKEFGDINVYLPPTGFDIQVVETSDCYCVYTPMSEQSIIREIVNATSLDDVDDLWEMYISDLNSIAVTYKELDKIGKNLLIFNRR